MTDSEIEVILEQDSPTRPNTPIDNDWNNNLVQIMDDPRNHSIKSETIKRLYTSYESRISKEVIYYSYFYFSFLT